MRTVIQRVKNASVTINGKTHGEINQGLVLLLGIAPEDDTTDINWTLQKIMNLRIFNDSENKMNLSLLNVKGELLIVSQFTLFASTKKGNRPSFIGAATPSKANEIYNEFIIKAEELIPTVKTGVFGAEMQISLVNNGPVTIIIDSKNKE